MRRLVLAGVLLFSSAAHAQGCSQCREQVGAAPAETRAAYRRAIAVLVVAGTGVFAAGVVVLRRFR